MGAEQSTLSAAQVEQQGKLFDAEIDKHAQEEKEKILRERREQREKKAAEQAHLQAESSTVTAEPGEVMEEPAADSIAVPIRSANSSQSTPAVKDVLAEWHPRKEKVVRRKKFLDEQRPGDEFVGSRKEPSLQEDKRQATKQPMKQPPRLDTGSDTITISRKPSSANPIKSPVSAKTASPKPVTIPTKRPATATAANETRHQSLSALSSLPKIQKRSSVASPQSPDRADGVPLKSVGNERPPKWYKDTPFSNARNKNDGNVDALLSSLRTHILKPKTLSAPQDIEELKRVFEQIRNKIHIIVFQQVNPQLLKRHRMLHNEDGLPQIFDSRHTNGVNWPWDIRADAEELYNKWCRRVFDTDIMRGIDFSKKDAGDSIYPDYKAKFVPSSKYHDKGDLINGQWWPFQICALRDGAHGSIQGGISGASGEGAYSCVMSGGNALDGNPYPNEDEGGTVFYCGTDSDDGKVTAYTQRMLESLDNGQAIRFIRSHNANTPYAPEVGFRYDGLYRVVGVERMDSEKSKRQRHRFRLVREAGQDPIRGGPGPEKRPTPQEIEEYRKHQRLSGKGKGQG